MRTENQSQPTRFDFRNDLVHRFCGWRTYQALIFMEKADAAIKIQHYFSFFTSNGIYSIRFHYAFSAELVVALAVAEQKFERATARL